MKKKNSRYPKVKIMHELIMLFKKTPYMLYSPAALAWYFEIPYKRMLAYLNELENCGLIRRLWIGVAKKIKKFKYRKNNIITQNKKTKGIYFTLK